MAIPTPKFDIYDTVTFLSKTDKRLPYLKTKYNLDYHYGGESLVAGLVGKITRYRNEIWYNSYTIDVEFLHPSYNRNHVYSMLECEFEEYYKENPL